MMFAQVLCNGMPCDPCVPFRPDGCNRTADLRDDGSHGLAISLCLRTRYIYESIFVNPTEISFTNQPIRNLSTIHHATNGTVTIESLQFLR